MPVTTIILFCTWLAINVFFILNIQNTLKAIIPEHRKITPGKAWIILIPVVGVIYIFILVKKLAESIQLGLKDHAIPIKNKPTYRVGLVYSILYATMVISSSLEPVSGWFTLISYLSTLGNLVFFIIYWVQVSDYKALLRTQVLIASERDLV